MIEDLTEKCPSLNVEKNHNEKQEEPLLR
jgi:hypothetical protein